MASRPGSRWRRWTSTPSGRGRSSPTCERSRAAGGFLWTYVDARDLATLAIRLRGVVKRYGEITAVNGLDLDVPEGTCVGLLGPNGAGKTTALRMAMGLIRATEGEIRVFGHKVTFGAPVRVDDGESLGRVDVVMLPVRDGVSLARVR